ncbi:MAG: GNAT family N-acetyltransferase [Bacteroidales bacterium]|nr:GNAT family N-acetyltransferase [Bacteroidales bacterium]
MEEIIAPVDRTALKRELTPSRKLRNTNRSNNEIYVLTAHEAPNVMNEIGRLREIAFRTAGGGSGLSMDIDEYDTMDCPYRQLIVWNPDAEEILGGYRFIQGTDVRFDSDGHPILATAHMFDFSQKFLSEYLSGTVELGRSFVTVEYQSSKAGSKGLFALDNLWDGLGALSIIDPRIKYFFGKMTMYPSFNRTGRDFILYFLHKHFLDVDRLVVPFQPIQHETDCDIMKRLFVKDDFKEDYKILNTEIRKLGCNIPPLVNAYMGLSPTMRCFGTAINHEFGDVEETGILINIDEIRDEKRSRHVESFIKELEARHTSRC